MFDKLLNLKINLSDAQQKIFIEYINIFEEYNKNVNLISRNDVNYLFEKHIYDSLSVNLFLEKYIKRGKNIKLLDIGTGGGFPALPIAILFPFISVYPVDSVNKKINFIKSASEKLGIKNIFPLACRIEDYAVNNKNGFDLVTSRAVAHLRIILEYALPFLNIGGYFIAYKSLKSDEELKEAENAISKLNTVLIDKIEYSLPLDFENKRVLLIFKKEKETPLIYPRRNGIIKKYPL